ncbi:hypothetical protein D3C76_1247180 [compost metagenome]
MARKIVALQLSKLLVGIMEVDALRVARTVYQRGKSEEEQFQTLRSLMVQPIYYFSGVMVPMDMILTCIFVLDGYQYTGVFNAEYLFFRFKRSIARVEQGTNQCFGSN